MKEQSQVEEMRAVIKGDRERALARIRADGRQPVFMREDAARAPASEPPAEEQLVDAQARGNQSAAVPSPSAQEALARRWSLVRR